MVGIWANNGETGLESRQNQLRGLQVQLLHSNHTTASHHWIILNFYLFEFTRAQSAHFKPFGKKSKKAKKQHYAHFKPKRVDPVLPGRLSASVDAATTSNARPSSLSNSWNHHEACGFIPSIKPPVYPITVPRLYHRVPDTVPGYQSRVHKSTSIKQEKGLGCPGTGIFVY